jgi:flagellar basal body-associated protein FliL
MLSIMILITIVMLPGALVALFMFIALAINLHWAAIPALFFTLLFSGAVYSGFTTSVHEIKARKLRKAKGPPKPWYAVSDDQTRNWFEKNPHLGIAITKKNFPNSQRPFA